jgi:hypothetical protein
MSPQRGDEQMTPEHEALAEQMTTLTREVHAATCGAAHRPPPQ